MNSNNYPVLSDEQIRRVAPSVFAETPHASRGDKYRFIPTVHVLDGLRDAGFVPVQAMQTRCRDEAKRPFTKHLLRLRHPDTILRTFRDNKIGSEIPEVVLVNSHDGTSSYQLMAGIFRLVCSNGMIVGHDISGIKVRHSKNVRDDVIEGSFRVIEQAEQITASIDRMKSIQLGDWDRYWFANQARELRFRETHIEPQELLQIRRSDDRDNSLWTTFNVIQENLMKGGIQYRTAGGRHMHTRGVGGVNQNLRTNQGLWDLAQAYANRLDPNKAPTLLLPAPEYA